MGDGSVDNDSAFSFDVKTESGFPEKSSTPKTSTAKGKGKGRKVPKAKYDELKGTISGFGTAAWATSGHFLAEKFSENNAALYPAGRMMQLQAPAAGKRIANILERTPLINLLAPIMGTKGIIGDIQALVMPPLLVYIVASKPELRESPIAQSVIAATMIPIAKEIIAAQNEQSNSASMFGEIDDETSNVVQEMMAAIFSPREETENA